MTISADIYLRLSDLANGDTFDGREAKLRREADRLGWTVHRVVTENDVNGNGKLKPASAFKRKRITQPDGTVVYRVWRPGFRSMLDDITAGRAQAILGEDLDRIARDPRDIEDLVDACETMKASARSLSGSLNLTNGGTDAEITQARIMVTMANQSSRDTRRRVKAGKERVAVSGYRMGGGRPYGYRFDPDSPPHQKTLLIVDLEAKVIRWCAREILASEDGLIVSGLARSLRNWGMPTVNGAAWSAGTLKDILIKPTVAGLIVRDGVEYPAKWPAILDRDVWEALRDRLMDPGRRTGTSNAPRWLLSGIAQCHCGGKVRVGGSKASGGAAYVCSENNDVRKNAINTDAYIEARMIERLSEPDIADFRRPAPRAGIDVNAVRAELRALEQRKASQVRMHAEGLLDDRGLADGLRHFKKRTEELNAQLAVSSETDPLAEFRTGRPAEEVWDSLSLSRHREVIRVLADVILLPSRRGPKFDDESLERGITWKGRDLTATAPHL